MYASRMLEIGKVENGYFVECRVPFKPKSKKEEMSCYEGGREKQYIAADQKELTALIDKLLPMLEESYSSEDEFNTAFEKMSGE